MPTVNRYAQVVAHAAEGAPDDAPIDQYIGPADAGTVRAIIGSIEHEIDARGGEVSLLTKAFAAADVLTSYRRGTSAQTDAIARRLRWPPRNHLSVVAAQRYFSAYQTVLIAPPLAAPIEALIGAYNAYRRHGGPGLTHDANAPSPYDPVVEAFNRLGVRDALQRAWAGRSAPR